MSESPDTVHGRLLEAVHISGYTFERACSELEWLLAEDRWHRVGSGHTDINEFLATIDLSEFRIAVEQRRGLARKLEELQASQRATAKALGVSHTTVQNDLGRKLPPVAETPHGEATEHGNDGKKLPPSEFSTSGKQIAKTAQRQAKRQLGRGNREQAKAEKRAASVPTTDGKVVHSAIADLRLDEPADVIITDPPYSREHLGTWVELAAFAARSLKPGGSLLAMSGQSYLPEIYSTLAAQDGLTYRWTLAYLTPGGQAVQLWDREVNTFWKPILWFIRDGGNNGAWVGDVVRSDVNDNDKFFHRWGQSESGIADLIDRTTKPGDLICDPFLGGGTTGYVAVGMGRRFIGADVDAECVRTSEARLAA